MTKKIGVVFTAVFVLAATGCAGAQPTPTPPPAPPPTPMPDVTPSPSQPAPTATLRPSPTAALTESPAAVLPGEPWIVYEWGVPEANSVGNMVIRTDGTDEHWATPDAPIGGTGQQGGDGWQLHPDWSPDGEQLAFVVDANTPEIPGAKRDIWLSDVDGTNTRQVFDCEDPCDGAEFPAWSKDGKSVLFVTWDHANKVSDGSLLRLLDVSSGKLSTIAETTGPEYFGYPRWSPDGTKIVTQIDTWTNITEDSELEHTSVAVVDLGTSPATITTITQPGEWANYPDWHPTDDLIVYSRRPEGALDLAQGHNDLYTMRPDGSSATLLVHNDLDATQPTWMPDGSGVNFVLVPGDDYSQAAMWAVNADGSNLRSFPDGPFGGSHPRLRPLPETGT